MDPTVTAAAIGVTGTVVVGVTGYWASVKNTSKTTELTRTAVELTRRTVELTEQGQVTERYTKAIDQLGATEIDVRVGGTYALERIARDSARSRRRGERANYPPRPSVNLQAGFIFTSTARTPRRSPPSSPASKKAT